MTLGYVNGAVEIPSGSRAKYELDKEVDMRVNHINDISELAAHFFRELETFFEDYKKLEKKSVVIEDFQSKFLALQIVEKAISDYQKKFSI